MQIYNQFNQGNIMPLLMNFTTPSQIQDGGFKMPAMGYDDRTQVSYEMRMLATRCAKIRPRTRKLGTNNWTHDYKNENDDTKQVR